jgi:enoyl-CoA hydratase/carnithine racemase
MNDTGSTGEPRVLSNLGTVTRITLNRPAQANALDWQMGVELEAAVERIIAAKGVRVVILSGAGKNFCSGGDLSFLEANTHLSRETARERMLGFYRMFLSLLRLPVPTIAVIRGNAVGAGLCLALSCDLRLGERSARLAANFVRLGLHPGMGGSVLLPALVGPARATELMLTGAAVQGETAASWGLLTRAVEGDALDVEAERLARELILAAPIALAQTLETLRAPILADLAVALDREAACQAENFGTGEVGEAVEAFKHKRAPFFGAGPRS